jgi:hypothetical protein
LPTPRRPRPGSINVRNRFSRFSRPMNDHSEPSDDRIREELLEQYVLGRLSPAERTEFEARLATDPALREALRQERDIVQGVRLAGRDDLKRRLAAAARTAPRRGVQWSRIAALAAMVLVVTGIALWQRWFFPAPSSEPKAAEPAITDRTPLAEQSNEIDKGTSRDEKRAAPGPEKSATQPPAEAETASPRLAAIGAVEQTYESAGIVVTDAESDRMRQNRMKGDAAARLDRGVAKPETPREGEKPWVDPHHYRVEIAPGRLTTASGESATGIPDTVRFTVWVRGDSAVIALAAGVLRPGKDSLTDARVTRVSPDSVIIDVAGVRIRGYLPRHFLP